MRMKIRRAKGWSVARLLLIFMLIIIVAQRRVEAQTTYGTVVGTARDASGAVVPNVKVTVTDQNSGTAYVAETDNLGSYHFPTLFPGLYNINAVASGFRADRYPGNCVAGQPKRPI